MLFFIPLHFPNPTPLRRLSTPRIQAPHPQYCTRPRSQCLCPQSFISSIPNMTPEEITSHFATAAATIQPIFGQPTNDDLQVLRDILYPLLLQILYNEDGTHNLIGILEPTATYTELGALLSRFQPVHLRTRSLPTMPPPSSRPEVKPNTPSKSGITPPMSPLNEPP